MTTFDWIVIAVVAISVTFAFMRGIIRSFFALASWIVGLVAAIVFTPALAAWFPQIEGYPWVGSVIAFALIFVLVLVIGALLSWPLARVVHKAGLGFMDRTLGAVFGLARAGILLLAFALVAGLTGLAQRDWWQNAVFSPPLAAGALALRPHLPAAWAERLDFSREGRVPASVPKKV